MSESRPARAATRQPALFVSHGAPTLALDVVAGADFTRMANDLPRPRAVLVLSAHWLDAPVTIGTTATRELMYDFGGFDPKLQEVSYRAPATAELAREVQALLPEAASAPARPWDHGVWVPLVHMYPAADVPVLQLSMPVRWTPEQLFALGRSLASLRDQNVLVLGSGGAVHNLRAIDWANGAPPAWAVEFEQWLCERLAARDVDALLDFRSQAPAVRMAHPTDEHLLPLLVTLGAADADAATFPIRGFEYGSLSRLAVRLG
ncbi:MAG: dioxygenase [Planctomycetes bacterium]|nr:dioxygenase [Planctomycetota bacterium]